jgi:hypothetical protein
MSTSDPKQILSEVGRLGKADGGTQQGFPMYLVRYDARPLANAELLVGFSGAVINVWVVAQNAQQARARAVLELEEAGWHIEALIEISSVTRQDYVDDSAGIGYFEQALMDDIVVVVHAWEDGVQH